MYGSYTLVVKKIKGFVAATTPLILSLPRFTKRAIVVAIDISCCILATWFAFYLRLNEFVNLSVELDQPAVLSVLFAIPIFIIFGLYKTVFRYTGWSAIQLIGQAMLVYTLLFATTVMAVGLEGTPRTIGLIQPILLFCSVCGSRLMARYWLGKSRVEYVNKSSLPKAVIYGAGMVGRQLARALDNGYEMRVVGFFDDDDRLHGQLLEGYPVFSPQNLAKLIQAQDISYVLLAMPSISRSKRKQILSYIEKNHVTVRTVPAISDLLSGNIKIEDIKDLDFDDLLDREVIEPDQNLLSKKVYRKIVLVTGAGGSIGSELCRQIIPLEPATLILVESSEFALYKIHAELGSLKTRLGLALSIGIIPVLGDIQDKVSMSNIFSTWSPQTLYHAAAYKHVPLVEDNVTAGVKNNILGTWNLACLAVEHNLSDFVLISTDKAVRPTNVMGATKRVAELILQAFQDSENSQCCFSMVRFGNVVASSGSVIPKFRRQIKEGGPITVTHPDVNRYFMTIREAAQLVIQAGALAKGGDVFVLDMGSPIKILNLARRMIRLSGLTEKTNEEPDGDIEIVITSLRPGEKLYEELLLGNIQHPTSHAKIMTADEAMIPLSELVVSLEKIAKLANDHDTEGLKEIFVCLVDGFSPQCDSLIS